MILNLVLVVISRCPFNAGINCWLRYREILSIIPGNNFIEINEKIIMDEINKRKYTNDFLFCLKMIPNIKGVTIGNKPTNPLERKAQMINIPLNGIR